MFNKKFILYILLSFAFFKGISQSCDITITGNVFDEASGMPLSYVNVVIQETQQGTITDEEGNYILEHICDGEFHFIFSHIGCEGKKFHFHIHNDTIINIPLSHTPTSLGTVVIEGKKDNLANQANAVVNRLKIEDNANQNLATLIENEAGVSLIKSGNGIAKPIVHGLYGNRLAILNNGIQQSGQQWGNDHSPEIDPYAFDKITVLKGASALEFGGGNLGSVILTEPKKIDNEPHLHGQVNYSYETNGRGNVVNTRLAKYSPVLAWKVNGTLKKYGDKKTSDYYLNNTGLEEYNLALQLEKSWNDKLFVDLYASTFNTTLGILRGSHIGNLTDLEQALDKDVPFFTEEEFSYDIEQPRQNVAHHLLKVKSKYFFSDDQILELVLAGQINDRKEFDIRKGGRSEIPSLSLLQKTINTELKYSVNFGEKWKFKIGQQNIITDNTNNPNTETFPLIPDYITWQSGLFSILSKKTNNTEFNLGLRYDFEDQYVLTISNTIPRAVVRYENQFHNVSGLFGIKSQIGNTQSISWNIGYAMRNPGINEFYSNGLHQGVSGIEEGDVNLKTEKALKNTLEYKWLPTADFTFNVLAYHQAFSDYIYLNPQDKIRLTIRGAFPVFKYEQTDANIYGLDVSTQYTINHSIFGLLKYSYTRGNDTKNDRPLIFMPPNSLFASFTYRAHNNIKLSNNIQVENTEIELSNRLVLEQTHLLQEQDFVAPPETFTLVGLKISSNFILPHNKIRCFIKVDNLLNTKYRDYLNRQRYFADDLGRSITLGINMKF